MIKNKSGGIIAAKSYQYEPDGKIKITHLETGAVINHYFNEDGEIGATQLEGSSLAIRERTRTSKAVIYGNKVCIISVMSHTREWIGSIQFDSVLLKVI